MRNTLVWTLLALTVGWSVAIAAAPRLRARAVAAVEVSSTQRGASGAGEGGTWRAAIIAVVYGAGRAICHQRPERSFHAAGVPYPLCARCTGLHLAAPSGLAALLAWRARRRSRRASPPPMVSVDDADPLRPWRRGLILAAAPTVVSVLLEWIGGPTGMTSRFLAALPLGAYGAALAGATLLGLDAAPDRGRRRRERV